MLKRIAGYFYKKPPIESLVGANDTECLYLDQECLKYFDRENIQTHALKMAADYSTGKTSYSLDDHRYGIDSQLYLYIQSYAFKAIRQPLAIAERAINYSQEGLKQMFNRYGRRVMHHFPKIDTRPKTLQTTKTFGIFSLVRVSTADVVMKRYAELTVPAKIYWSSSSEKIQEPKLDCYVVESVDIADEVPDAFCITYVFGDKKQYRYVRF